MAGFLKRVSDGPVYIKDLLHAKVGGMEEARQHTTIHASMLTSDVEFCPRRVMIAEREGIKRKARLVDTPLRMTFDQGWHMQYLINNNYLRDIMYGNWKCKCDTLYGYLGSDLTYCSACKTKAKDYVYEEIVLRDDKNGFTGSVDGFVLMRGRLHLLEVKIMDKDLFKALKLPMAEHKARTQLYLQMVKEDPTVPSEGIPFNLEDARLLYIMRGFGMKDDKGRISPFKEFIIKASPSNAKIYQDKALSVHNAREYGTMPDRICPNAMCTRAELCSLSKRCFSGAYKD